MVVNQDVCGLEHAKWLDNGVRKLIHNPYRLFGRYVRPGATVLDIGCGPGAFTVELARMAGDRGSVIAVDLQEEMLHIAQGKVARAGMLNRVRFHQCSSDSLGLDLRADFIVTFYMVHEAPDPLGLIDQICDLLAPGGLYYLSEPKFHVTGEQYGRLIAHGAKRGLTVLRESGVFSRTAVFRKPFDNQKGA